MVSGLLWLTVGFGLLLLALSGGSGQPGCRKSFRSRFLPRLAVRIVGPGLLPFVEELLDGPAEGSLSAGRSVRRVVVGDCFGPGAEAGFQDQEMYWDIGTEVEQLVSGRPAWGGLLIPSRQ